MYGVATNSSVSCLINFTKQHLSGMKSLLQETLKAKTSLLDSITVAASPVHLRLKKHENFCISTGKLASVHY